MKYCPQWPSNGFESLSAVRGWMLDFSTWYNEEHCHSGISFVTPQQRHKGEDKVVLAHRDAVYRAARQKNPSRWTGNTRDWSWDGSVDLNPKRVKVAVENAA